MGRIQLAHTYKDIISFGNLLAAWNEFVKGKRKKRDVQDFQYRLSDNLLELHYALKNKNYRHGGYEAFKISDPKPRDIHKAIVRDRVLHHALYRKLYPFFDRTFIADSYSCRLEKGNHRAFYHFENSARSVSMSHTKTAWILKCDIRKFFASIDQQVLMKILQRYIPDQDILALFANIIQSFHSTMPGKGLPLGNLTSQLLVNIYLNEFDQFVKHKLKVKYYIRYADDFVILSPNRNYLTKTLQYMEVFLRDRLKLEMRPDKVFVKTLASGVDFLGWVHFPDHRVLRTATKKRMFRRIEETRGKKETIESYLGLLSHGNTYKLQILILNGRQS